jgi:hypothetical protein
MATETERPPSRVDGKANPAYAVWRREQKEKSLDHPASAELTLRAIGGARNTNYVRASLGNGDAVYVRVRKGMAPKLIGKPIKVEVTEHDGEKRYTHVR